MPSYVPTLRRSLRVMAAFCIVATTLTSKAAEPTEITVAAYASYYQDNFEKAVVKPFEAKYPQIKVNYFAQRSSAERLGTLRAEKSAPSVDVAIMDVSVAAVANDEKLFAPIDVQKVPNLKELYPQAKVAGDMGPAITFDSLALIYNASHYPTKPSSWKTLWDPKNKGMVVLNAPPNIQGLALTIIATRMAGGDYATSVQPGINLMKSLAPSVQSWSPTPDAYTLIENGTADVGIGWNSFSRLYEARSDGKLRVVTPQEGTVSQVDTINLVAGSKQREAALVFINYALSKEAQTALSRIFYFSPVNKFAAVAPEAASKIPSIGSTIPVNWGLISAQRNDWLQKWRTEVIQ